MEFWQAKNRTGSRGADFVREIACLSWGLGPLCSAIRTEEHHSRATGIHVQQMLTGHRSCGICDCRRNHISDRYLTVCFTSGPGFLHLPRVNWDKEAKSHRPGI